MPRMTLTGMPANDPIVLSFEADTKFIIDNGPEGFMILALYPRGSRQIAYVRKMHDQIISAHAAALSDARPF